MNECQLIRQETSDQGTFGKFYTPTQGFYSAELPWRDNANDFSCIPVGDYIVKWEWSPSRGRNIYELKGVPNRNDVQIHSGNYAGDTKKGFKSDVLGCILLGANKIVPVDGKQKMLSDSRASLAKFETEMKHEDFKLKVSEEYHV